MGISILQCGIVLGGMLSGAAGKGLVRAWRGFAPRAVGQYKLSMRADFLKMHGAGNDFVVVDERARSFGFSPAQVRGLSDRRLGVGCDQFITLEPGTDGADVFMRIRNPDGSESGACGNATRCVARLLAEESGGSRFVIRTIAGDLRAEILSRNFGSDEAIRVDMGPAWLGWERVPLARPMDTLHLDLAAGNVGDPVACSMGNPHATFFVDDMDAVDVTHLGPVLETDALFPERANIGFAQILAPDAIRLRVWERGAGLTLACGSGACATLVNAARRGLTGRRAVMVLDGGVLTIEWREDGHVLMTGPAALAWRGSVDLADYAA